MRIQGHYVDDRTVVLGLVAIYAASALIILGMFVETSLWPTVSAAL